jgi:hypothetical protein
MREERGRYGDITGEKDRVWVMRHDCGKECFACASMQRVQMNIGYPHGSHSDIRSIIQSSVATLSTGGVIFTIAWRCEWIPIIGPAFGTIVPHELGMQKSEKCLNSKKSAAAARSLARICSPV